MRVLFIGLFISFLSVSCANTDTKEQIVNQQSLSLNELPNDWQFKARLSIHYDNNINNFDLSWFQEGEIFSIKISSFLAIQDMHIISDGEDIFVNKRRVLGTFKQWMLANYNYFFPIEKTPAWLFNIGDTTDENWQVEYLEYDNFNNGYKLPSKIKFVNNKVDIIITFVVKEFNF